MLIIVTMEELRFWWWGIGVTQWKATRSLIPTSGVKCLGAHTILCHKFTAAAASRSITVFSLWQRTAEALFTGVVVVANDVCKAFFNFSLVISWNFWKCRFFKSFLLYLASWRPFCSLLFGKRRSILRLETVCLWKGAKFATLSASTWPNVDQEKVHRVERKR